MLTGQKSLNVDSTADKVSVIIVTYNAAATLQACLDSIYKQTYPNIEIVVIDGKSTDDTVAILEANSSRIGYWKSEPDSGIYDAMNKATKKATGKWVYFLGADDALLPGFSDLAYDLKDNSAIYYSNVWAEGAKRSGELSTYQFAKVGIYHQAMIYPASIFAGHNFDTKYRISADFAFNLNLYSDKAYHFLYKDHLIANFNHTGISGTQIDVPFAKDKSGLILKNFGFKIWSRYIFRMIKSKIKGDKNPRI
ncbi:glycosyltransferase [Mucilaginibacter rigui]|uniref:Glycosyltransferase n=1 Tax=Mucilaginibacter rigui TaxID=534635 RepID=A0ABR7X4J7_9SPHI|nr:glycosyltransferase family 2 protein [Mucilaginibacter rigui]MBD1385507.1 glycosyltransferase [Mucilaginibacter rigui]